MVVPPVIEREKFSAPPELSSENDERGESGAKEAERKLQEEKNYFVAVQYSEKAELH